MRSSQLLPTSATDGRVPGRCFAALVALTGALLGGCGEPASSVPHLGGSTSGGAGQQAANTGGASAVAGGSSSAPGVGGASSSGGAAGAVAIGTTLSSNGTPTPARDHCTLGYLPDPSDSDPTMLDGPSDFLPSGVTDQSLVDTTVQPQVLKFMQNNSWEAAHVEWHAIRGCNVPGQGNASQINICSYKTLVPSDQNCQDAGDGYQFLVFHRHMIMALKQLWPNHSEQFTGFTKFPTSAADVPPEWRSAWKDWDADTKAAGLIGDAIDTPENLARFPDEGTLGFWLQCNVGQKLTTPANTMPWVGLHFALHAKWARPGNTAHGVNNTSANIDNYMFWKLHGWIDNVWEKYRLAKGMLPTDQKLKDDLATQCREMHTEIALVQQKFGINPPDESTTPLPVESGFFHEMVRPIFESQTNLCSGCHAESGANAMLTLGGHISSADIVANLVNRPSNDGGQYKLVVPGDPDHSWLYLKPAGKAASAGCVASSTAQCITGVMPPTSDTPTVSADQLAIIRQWIMDGAQGPPAVSN